MASRPKSGNTRTRRTSARSRKPATIDLEAKEVTSEEAKPESVKKATSVPASKATDAKQDTAEKSPQLGRAGSAAKKETAASAKPAEARPKQDESKKAGSAETATAKAAPTPEKAPVKPVPAQTKQGNAFFPAIGGALAAVLGLGIIGQIDSAKNIPLIGSLYGGGAEVSTSVDAGQFEALQQRVAELSSSASSGTTVDLAPVNNRIAELESLMNSISSATSDGSSVVDAALVARIEAIETGIAAVKEDLSAIGQNVTNPGGITASDLETAVSAINSRIDGVESSAGDAEISEKITQLDGQFSKLSGSLETIQGSVAENTQMVSELVSQSTDLRDTVASVQASEKVAKSVAVNALATALDNDDPLALTIASVEALVGETPETQRLAALAASGIPTIKQLVSDLDVFTGNIQNPSAVSGDASLSDKFWANAQSLVTFRSTGPREGDDPLAILSRVKAGIGNGDLASAKTEWLKLPVDVQTKGEAWVQKLDARIEAYALQKEISSKLALQAG
ncbi:MAG: hypothetical protein AAGA76_07145 [Pseudomonadota bacterium]